MELNLFSRWEDAVPDMSTALDNIAQNDINFMETKSIFVQLLRSLPGTAEKRPIDLAFLAERSATSKDPMLVRRGIKVQNLLSELEAAGVISKADNYKLLSDEVAMEMVHLGNAREKVVEETRSLESVYRTICDHNNYLRSQIEQYKAYLINSRKMMGTAGRVGVVSVGGKGKPTGKRNQGPYRFTHSQFEKEKVILESNVPENRRQNIFFNITSPEPGAYIIALHFKGREKPIIEMDLKLDDLLEKVRDYGDGANKQQKDSDAQLDLEYVQLSVPEILKLFNKLFSKKSQDRWGVR